MREKMKKILIILLLTLTNSALAGGQYRATELFSTEDVRDLVISYYKLHDSRAEVSDYLELLVDDGLYMVMGSEVESKKEFKSWLKKMRFFSKSVRHSVEDIEILEQEDGSFFVDSCIRYKGKLRFGIGFDKSDKIIWKIVESSDKSKLLIKTYIVKSGCN